MPLLDHFHPPLHGPRRWEGFHHSWASAIAQQLNLEALPPGWFAEPEITLGPTLEIDVATMEESRGNRATSRVGTAVWAPPRPKISTRVDFSHLDSIEVLVYQDLGDAELRAAVELVSPADKNRKGRRRTFAAKCAGYLRHGVSVVIIDVVTSRSANLHRELFEVLEVKTRRTPWESGTGLYSVSYRPVTVQKRPRIEVWPEALALHEVLPTLPLWLDLQICIPLHLETTYTTTCRSLRIPA
jgi:hypothetical protein